MLHVGFGSADVTPEVGMDMPGGFYANPSKGVLEKLLATACVIHDGSTWIALVGIDSLGIPKSIVQNARARIAKETKIPAANVLVGANHSHSGGPSFANTYGEPDPKYIETLTQGIASAVIDATKALHAAEIGIGTGREETLAFNRRFLMRDGREITHPGKPGTEHNKDIVKIAGPTDPDVGVLAFRAAGGGPILGVVAHFGCHSTIVGGNQYHPDYAGPLRKHLKARYGEGTGAVFLLGPCGDITQVDNQAPGSEFGLDFVEMFGQKLALEAIRTVNRMEWKKEAQLAATSEQVPLTVRPEPDVERETPPYGLGSSWHEQYSKGRAMVAGIRARTPMIPTEVQALKIGSLGIATNGAEFFCELGLRIKAASPFATTWVVELANDLLFYVPTPQAMLAGGYESRTNISSMYSIDAGQLIVEASLRGLRKLT